MNIRGSVISFLGDSITQGVGVTDQTKRFDSLLNSVYGAETYNFGISGTRLAHQHHASENPRFDLCFCGRAYDLPKDSDIIVVYGGTNDYGHGDASFGNKGDRTPETYIGAVDFLMKTLKTEYPNAKVVFMTPARRLDDEQPTETRVMQTGEKRVLKEFVDVIVEAGKENGVYVFDMYRDLGLDPNDADIMEKYAPDGLHFNEAGHAVIAEKLTAFIENI